MNGYTQTLRRAVRGGGLAIVLALVGALAPALPARAQQVPWSGWSLFTGLSPGSPAVGQNLDGRLEVFVRGMDNALWHRWQTAPSNGWSGWESLGGSWRGNPVVARNQDGRLEVFIRGGNFDTVHHIWQLAPNGRWSGWEDLGNRDGDRPTPGSGPRIVGDPAVGRNADGRLEVFGRLASANAQLVHVWQVRANGTWSNWEYLSAGDVDGQPVVFSNADGRLEVFFPGRDVQGRSGLLHTWQPAPSRGPWSHWENLGHGILVNRPNFAPADLTMGRNADGRLEVFWRGSDNRIYHVWQVAPNSSWSGLEELPGGGLTLRPPSVVSDALGRLDVFVIGLDGGLWHNRQDWSRTPPWTNWISLAGGNITDHAVGMNADGRLEAFARTSDGNLWHKWQERRP
jgi:hypothetical protein